MRGWSIQLSMVLLMGCTDDKSTDTPDRPTVEDVGSDADADADTGSGSGLDASIGTDDDDSTPVEAEPVGRDVVTYVGGLGTVLSAGLQLSDGSFLLGGSSPDLAWLPEETEVVELSLPAVDSAASGLAILLHLSPGLETIEAAWHFPEGTVRDIRRIRTTNVPGAPTGTLFVSGSRDDTAGDDGYYIARLDGNVVDVPLTGASWSYDVDAPRAAREAGAASPTSRPASPGMSTQRAGSPSSGALSTTSTGRRSTGWMRMVTVPWCRSGRYTGSKVEVSTADPRAAMLATARWPTPAS